MIQFQSALSEEWSRARPLGADEIASLGRALAARGVTMEYFETGEQAFARLRELIPLSSQVSTGSSTTLDQIGFTRWLQGLHEGGKLRYFRAETQQNADPAARVENRRQATLAQCFIGSVNALALTGEALAADQAGTRVGGYVYGAEQVIWVVGTNKLVPSVEEGIRRIREYALPMEDARVRAEGGSGSSIGKLVIFCNEPRKDRVRLLLVGESLGF